MTFTSLGEPENVGDLPLLEAHDAMTMGTAASLRVRELAPGCCTLELSFNGVDFTDDHVTFKYDEAALVLDVAPRAGSVRARSS